ncbi:protein NYNRIN-like [Gymnodraco acuticeps]|uniref:Protein NYNRIN-like n=1 Tax=Gymnodraco acuticeps TaxID=8218 RepID=A0A6P8WJ68_GYMAC|nr:protein NYNRIN-like [Gymnodraco acuticeps]
MSPLSTSSRGIALTVHCTFAEGKTVTIYTDSRYAFGVVHDFGAIWKCRQFLKSDGKPVLNHVLVAGLLNAILLPSEVAVCKCAAHASSTDPVSLGNAPADSAAKAAALIPLAPHAHSFVKIPVSSFTDKMSSLTSMQQLATPVEKAQWKAAGAAFDPTSSIWVGPNSNPCLPRHFFPHFAKLTHGLDHVSKGGMLEAINQEWFTRGFTVTAQKHCEACLICIMQNSGRPVKVTGPGAHPPPTRPFEHLMLDFIELSPSEGKKHCLVVVDMWSKWVEAFPVKAQTANAVAKALLREIIPRWGLPDNISSDNGSHFANEAITQIGEYMGMDIRKHCAYHPQSGGGVERENGTIKNKLAKCCADTGLSWTQALPIVLMYMRMRKRTRSQLSPFEILFGAPPQIGLEAPGQGWTGTANRPWHLDPDRPKSIKQTNSSGS